MTLYVDTHKDYEPFDCETCGPSWDSFEIDYTGDGWHVQVRVGCTGGDTFTGTRREVIDWLAAETAWVESSKIFDLESLREVIRLLEEA